MDWRYIFLFGAVIIIVIFVIKRLLTKTNTELQPIIPKIKDSQEEQSIKPLYEEKNEKNAKFKLEMIDRELVKNPNWVAAVKNLEYAAEGKLLSSSEIDKTDPVDEIKKESRRFSNKSNAKVFQLVNQDLKNM